MEIIMTGSSGFIGGNLKKYLQKEGVHRVYSLSLRSNDWKNQLSNNSGEVIIHLAGKGEDTKKKFHSDEYFSVNRDLTIALFDYFLQADTRDFLFFSSVKAVADTFDGVLEEVVKAEPKTPYGISKWLTEEYIMSKVLPEGKRVFIFRPSMVHGPGNKGNLNLLYKFVKKGLPWPLAAFENQRSFLSIDNLHFVINQILNDGKIPGGVYNIVDDEPLSTNNLVTLISEVLGREPRLWKVPNKLVVNAAKFGDLMNLPLNTERLQKLTESFVVSNQKIKAALRINRLPLSGEEGLKRTLESF